MITELGFIHRYQEGVRPDSPTLVLLHGTGGNEDDLLPLAASLGNGYGLLSPRGKVLEEGMPRFFRRLREGIFDQQDLSLRTQELAGFLADAAERYGCNAGKFIGVGFSNGANIAASLLLRRPEVLAGAVLIRAMQPFEVIGTPDLAGKQVLLLNGTRDPIVPREQPELLAATFKRAGAETTLHWEAAGHALTQNDIVVAREWLATHFPA